MQELAKHHLIFFFRFFFLGFFFFFFLCFLFLFEQVDNERFYVSRVIMLKR